MASWPTAIKSFTTRNSGDTVQPAHINDLQDEVAALQASFINGQYRCSVYNSATQSINDSSATALAFNSEDFDTGGLHDTGSNTSRITIPANAAGAYLFIGGATFPPSATGYRQVTLKKNGTTDLVSVTEPTNAAGAPSAILQVSHIAVLSAADYVELFVTQTSGGAQATGSATRAVANYLQAARLW